MLKHLDVNKLMPTSKACINRCIKGSTMDGMIEDLMKPAWNSDMEKTDVVIHTGSNNLPRAVPNEVINKIARALHLAKQKYLNAEVYYSPLIPKYNNDYISTCDHINHAVGMYCKKKDITSYRTGLCS